MPKKNIHYNEEEKAFLKANCTMNRRELTGLFNEKFDRKVNVENIKRMCLRHGWKTGRTGCFKKGNVPWSSGLKGLGILKPNSGNFKKGQKPHNSAPIGTVAITKGWVKVKVAEPNVWRNQSHLIWEKHHGKPPAKGEYLIHLDCDFTNNAIENLVMVSRADLARLNKKEFRKHPIEVRPAVVALSKIENKLAKLKGNRNA